MKFIVDAHLPAVVQALEGNSLVELDRQTVQVIA
jgi:hypothetical protein